MRQKRQGGSTVGYILIGIVLIGALVGGVYTLRRVTSEKPAEVSQTSKEQDKSSEANKEEQTSSDQSSKDDSSESSDATKTDSQTEKDNSNSGQQAAESGVKTAELPKTGPSSVANVLITGLVTVVGAAYVQSRRATL
jgi:LPXTG-motif cell wall-anchored protein